MLVRELSTGDGSALEAFLVRSRDTSMFLRANLRRAGLTFRPAAFHATYVASFDSGELVGVVAHTWNGMLLMQAPGNEALLARAALEASGRRLHGFSGPRAQVRLAQAALGPYPTPPELDGDEVMYALELAALRQPERDPTLDCRLARPGDREELVRWRLAYELETLGASDIPETRQRAETFLDRQLQGGHAWVASSGPRLLSLSALNAALPDIVQLGGIYTPPAQRSRGYARRAIGAQLSAAGASGVTRAVLFTQNPHAMRCYESLGFRRTGEFALVLMR